MLVDSNIIIYTAQPELHHVQRFIVEQDLFVSAISYVEVLGDHGLTERERQLYERFFEAVTVLPLDQSVVHQAALLRQQRKMSLGDALIAATAFLHQQTLVTRNTKDFAWIPSLTLLNPFDVE